MVEVSIPAAGDPFASKLVTTSSTRHHRCNHDFLELLEEDFGISQFALRSAFLGVPNAPKKQAIAMCEWAIRSAKNDTVEAGHALRNWARKRGVGVFNPYFVVEDDDEEHD